MAIGGKDIQYPPLGKDVVDEHPSVIHVSVAGRFTRDTYRVAFQLFLAVDVAEDESVVGISRVCSTIGLVTRDDVGIWQRVGAEDIAIRVNVGCRYNGLGLAEGEQECVYPKFHLN